MNLKPAEFKCLNPKYSREEQNSYKKRINQIM